MTQYPKGPARLKRKFKMIMPLLGLLLSFFLFACAPLPQEPGWPGLLFLPGQPREDGSVGDSSFIITYINRVHRVNARNGESFLLPPVLRSAQDGDDFSWRVESCVNKGGEAYFSNNWSGAYFAAAEISAAGDALYIATHGAGGGSDAVQFVNLESGEVDFGDCLPLGAGVLADLVRDGDTLYIAQVDGRLLALDLTDELALRWEFQAGDAVWATPLLLKEAPLCQREADEAPQPLSQPMLILASLDHHLYALDPETGTVIWQRNLGGTVASPPRACWQDQQLRLYVGSFASRVYALDGADGAEIFRPYQTENWVWGQPSLDEQGRLYVADLGGYVYQLGTDLSEGWVKQVAQEGIRVAPQLLDQRLLVAARDGQVYLLYLDDGTVAFNENLRHQVLSDILVLPGEGEEEPLIVFATTHWNEMLRAFRLDGDRLRPVWLYDGS